MTSFTDINGFSASLARRLQGIYPLAFREVYVNRILGLITRHPMPGPIWDQNDVVLITYGNTFTAVHEKPLVTLRRFLDNKLRNTISCIHILPFYPSTSDDGFSVSDYESVVPELGEWDDIAGIGKHFSLMFDLVINHVSASHPWFINFLNGRSPGRDYFIEMDPEADYHLVVRPRSSPLFSPFTMGERTTRVWTTFSADQVDLNFANPEVLIEMIRVLLLYISKGARIIRLDAIAFLWKEQGSSCLHLSQTHELIRLIRDIVTWVNPHIILLTETNVPNRENWSYFSKDDEAHMVYQFSLPPLLLYTLYTGNARFLTSWAESIPATGGTRTFLNFTASHDGIGIRPLEGILTEQDIQSLIMGIRNFGGLVSEKRNPDGTHSPYEMNITYLDALNGTQNGPDQLQDKRFLCSQLIMLALQGIPAVYIQSLLGTGNDYEGVKKTGRARSINRKQWDEEAILHLLSTESRQKHIFEEYIRVINIRKQITAFHPDCPQQILLCGDPFFALIRENPTTGERVYCISNITSRPVILPKRVIPSRIGILKDILAGNQILSEREMRFGPYQTRWLC